MTMRLALMRHGPTPWNREHRIQGRADIPLDDEARAELQRLSLDPPWTEATLWSSPLARARETAEILAGRAPRISDALIEMDWGEWEGRRGADLLAEPGSGYRHVEEWGWSFTPPGGECVASVRERVDSWLCGLEGCNLAIGHIGVMRVVLAIVHGWDFLGPRPFAVKRNRLHVIERTGDRWHAQTALVRLREST